MYIKPFNSNINIMKILSIETSCDETALAIIEAKGYDFDLQFKVLSSALNSQINLHKEFGGVFPSLAKREHAHNLPHLLEDLFLGTLKKTTNTLPEDIKKEVKELLNREEGLYEKLITYIETHEKPDVDMIAVTSGPGLEPALWVGINSARALSLMWNIPVLPVNHMEGHIASVLLEPNINVEFPAISLLISGGHTELIKISKWGEYEILGRTLDDAIGEAYDKIARMIGISYPGGPEVSMRASKLRKEGLEPKFEFPRPMLHSKDLDFSFSGIKTSVLYKTQELGDMSESTKDQVAYSFEEAVVEVIKKKTQDSIDLIGAKSLIVGGGVIANTYIRESLKKVCDDNGIIIYLPEKDLSTDNAVMIGAAGYLKSLRSEATINPEIKADGNWRVDS